MSWRLAESLKKLREQLNESFPRRSKVSDGSIGDAAHSSRTSDHNPNSKGIVCAIDVTNDPETGPSGQWLADTLVRNRDPRIKYIIWNHKICSSTNTPWTWRPYHGINGHTHHVHISVAGNVDSRTPWKLDFPQRVRSDVAKVLAEPSDAYSGKTDASDNPQLPASDPTGTSPETTQIAQNIVNTGDPPPPPTGNVSMDAPQSMGTTSNAGKVTILGLTVPPVIIGFFKMIGQWFQEGRLDVQRAFDFVVDILQKNMKYVFIMIGLWFLILIIKKLERFVLFAISVLTHAIPQWNSVTINPGPPPEKKWWKVWK